MFSKPLEALSKEDIEAFLAEKIPEGKMLDYKLQLPGGSSSDKKEFLYDITSFANTEGGWIIYGVGEQKSDDGKSTGLPGEAVGVEVENFHGTELGFLQSLRTGVERPIHGVRFKCVPGFPKGGIIVARIPRNWGNPHMVTLQDADRFYMRGEKDKRRMRHDEIAAAFMGRKNLAEKARANHLDRVAGYDELRSTGTSYAVLSFVPLASLSGEAYFDVPTISSVVGGVRSLSGFRLQESVNFDGILLSDLDKNLPGGVRCCTRLFRSGAIEAMDTQLIYRDEGQVILGGFVVKELVRAVGSYIQFQRSLNLDCPTAIFLSIMNVKGFKMVWDSYSFPFGRGGVPIDRSNLHLPEVVVEEGASDAGRILRPIFDGIWNACGFEKCTHYDSAGNFSEKEIG